MNTYQNPLALLGRLLLAALFLPAGVGKLLGGVAGTAGYIASKGLPMPEVLAVATIALEIGAGLMLLLGFKTRWAAFALALFTLAAGFLFHNYWAMPEAQQMMQKLMFNKNLAIAGGLFVLAAFGAGSLSLDGQRRA